MGHLSDSVLLALLVTLIADYAFAEKIIQHTSGGNNYTLAPFRIAGLTHIEFEVKACQDVFVLLMWDETNEDSSHHVQEIGIGLGGSRSVIRASKEQEPPVAEVDIPGILHCHEFRRFWISWDRPNKHIRVGTGFFYPSYTRQILLANIPVVLIERKHFRIKTSVDGEWNLGSSCSISGDPHVTTFDMKEYSFNGVCRYDLIYILDTPDTPDIPNFMIEGDFNYCRNNRSCLGTVMVQYGTRKMYFLRPNMVKKDHPYENSSPLTMPDNSVPGFRASENPENTYNYKIVVDNGVNLLWDGQTKVMIQLQMAFENNVYGMCGTYTNNKADDFTKADLTTILPKTEIVAFADSWKTPLGCQCQGGGGTFFKDYCWVYMDSTRTYAQAKETCKNSYGGTLVDVMDQETDQFIKNTYVTSGIKKYWVRATYQASKNGFVWEGSSPPKKLESWGWLDGAPNDATSQDCVSYVVDGSRKGWAMDSCDTPHPLLCTRID